MITVMQHRPKMPARYTRTQRIARYVKIGYVIFLDSVATYALFKIPRPLFFS